jgi:hypothetical protein
MGQFYFSFYNLLRDGHNALSAILSFSRFFAEGGRFFQAEKPSTHPLDKTNVQYLPTSTKMDRDAALQANRHA